MQILTHSLLVGAGGFAGALARYWLAGFIALRLVREPNKAGAHFKRGLDASSSSWNLAQMTYWLGRTAEAEEWYQRSERAVEALERAAVPVDAEVMEIIEEEGDEPADENRSDA